MANNKRTMIVQGEHISVTADDFISLTDMLKAKDGDFFISDWLRNRNTVEYPGIRERIHNLNFNYGEFATIKSSAGLNSYKISVKEWVSKTSAIGIKQSEWLSKLNQIAISQMKILVTDHRLEQMQKDASK